MKKIYSYSEKKFTSFTQHKQLSIILEMLQVLEKNFQVEEYARALQKSLNLCFIYLDNANNAINSDWKKYDLTQLSDVISLRDELLKDKDIFLRDSDIVIKRYDASQELGSKFPIVVILDNLRSAFNVGSIIRSSECLGVLEIALCGKTPGIDNRKVFETAMGTADYVKLRKFKNVMGAIAYYRQTHYEIIALELTNNSISLTEYKPKPQVALIVGNESLGIAEETLKECNQIIEIKMYGVKNSLNVGNATAIALHNIGEKMEE